MAKTRQTDQPHLARRRCKVCDWEDAGVEQPGSDPLCPWCYAPTELIEEPGTPSSHAAALGRLGGLKGGLARAAALSSKQRKAIASKAARARWSRRKPRRRKSPRG